MPVVPASPVDPTRRDGNFDVGEYTYYLTRNYDTSVYNYDIEVQRNIELNGVNHHLSKTKFFIQKCLEQVKREPNETMMSIERDKEYYPSFK